uniref:Uncharacterized protein n=1 Tax=Timema poppense TaxID=170557 RepID=A0A7R9CYT6_TIMPO|nr:unnamed protein product [Timema poppensis]
MPRPLRVLRPAGCSAVTLYALRLAREDAHYGILPPQGTVVERDRKKCIYYSLYAWGSTILISVISLIMEFTPGIPDTFLKPGFGKKTCWFERSPIFFFFSGYFLPWPVDIPRVLDSSSPASRLFPSEQSSSSKEQPPTSHLYPLNLLLPYSVFQASLVHQRYSSLCRLSSATEKTGFTQVHPKEGCSIWPMPCDIVGKYLGRLKMLNSKSFLYVRK